MPAAPTASSQHIKDVNVRYHDAAASSYNAKWGLDYGPESRAAVRAKLVAALGGWPARPFAEALEIGAGTGFLSLNLLQLGAIEHATATDISPGMLTELAASASALGFDVATRTADAERLPFDDDSFDAVLGHAILHHLPDLERAFAEAHRVLRAGGTIVLCGEPSRAGSLVAQLAMRCAFAVAPLWRRALRIPPRPRDAAAGRDEELEREVDVHTFTPAGLRAGLEAAGFADVRIQGAQLLSSCWGWACRALESSADPERIPEGWRRFSLAVLAMLARLDSALLERIAPTSLLYNLELSARKPTTR